MSPRPARLPEAIDLVGRSDVRIIHDGEMWKMVSARITDAIVGEEIILYLRQGAQIREAHLQPRERVILVD
ncbi:hypothetical protein E3_0070 [Rhodococcus phage E3]|uniref:hypothetical protein n=1 Tax=Rhodococcus phage E3 TaxID=1007869 RepID=UPI0002C6B706|nr:hypothetical protein M176_gp007 [Rhodococcus phage E3]AEQ20917.1 hypothetical protein E3_0070 [Rhodococcus phage E3]